MLTAAAALSLAVNAGLIGAILIGLPFVLMGGRDAV